ncbi:MAG: hypothetical protein LBU38_02585 [Propionibacteriaceae bacterium]|jgi:hypothetical protein|nr:hypothetical protein [Propionibacteriaceae bacterium]
MTSQKTQENEKKKRAGIALGALLAIGALGAANVSGLWTDTLGWRSSDATLTTGGFNIEETGSVVFTLNGSAKTLDELEQTKLKPADVITGTATFKTEKPVGLATELKISTSGGTTLATGNVTANGLVKLTGVATGTASAAEGESSILLTDVTFAPGTPGDTDGVTVTPNNVITYTVTVAGDATPGSQVIAAIEDVVFTQV